MRGVLLFFIRGLFMGIADVIPGVSGGTIAFITGIYHRLIHAISNVTPVLSNLVKFKWKDSFDSFKKLDFQLLIPLVLGIGTAIFFFSKFIGVLLESSPAPTYAFFFGLIVASALLLVYQMGKLTLHKGLFIILGFIIAYQLALASSVNASHSLLFIFVSGAIAICAMLLPGISGAFILLLLGQYEFVVAALHSYNIPVILTFIAGALTGLLSFSKLIDYLLHNYKQLMLAFLTGIMLGSLQVPVQHITSAGALTNTIAISGALGIVIVFGIDWIFQKKK